MSTDKKKKRRGRTVLCSAIGCEEEATHIWSGEALCHDHAIDKREALLNAIIADAANKSSTVWTAYYNSKYPAGDA